MQSIATRSYRTPSGREVVVTLHAPVNDIGPHAWTCPFTIHGLAKEVNDRGIGMDALQAIIVAIQGIRYHLDAAAEDIAWEGGDPGDLGIALPIPEGFGPEIRGASSGDVERRSGETVSGTKAAKVGGRERRWTTTARDAYPEPVTTSVPNVAASMTAYDMSHVTLALREAALGTAYSEGDDE